MNLELRTNIILIGFMGTGKTTISQRVAQRLGWDIIDMDALIVHKAGKPISAIFAEDGENAFRDLENLCLQPLNGFQNKVISTGGGIILREKNRHLLKQLGKVFLLEASPQTIIDRLADDTSRPLLQGSNEEKLKKIEKLLSSRQLLYEETADYIIETSDQSPEDIAEEILKQL